MSCSASRERSQRARPWGPSSVRRCLEPAGGSPFGSAGQLRARVRARRRAAERAVDGPLRQQAQDARRAVAAGRDRGELRALVDERRVQVARAEVGVVEQLAEERLVRRHAADADLLDRSPRPRDRGLHVDAARRELQEQRVEVGGDLRADVGRALVEAHPGAARRAVGGDRAGVRAEARAGVLRRDPALQREPALADLVLRQVQLVQARALGDEQLRAHEVDVRRLLGHGVLDLDPRVHLDEDVLALRVVDEELDRARVHVADVRGELHGVGADAVAELGVEVRRGGDLDDLLVAALDRAVALEEVHEPAVPVGEDLYLDVPRADHRPLEVDGGVAERALGLAAGGADGLLEVVEIGDEAHAAPAAAVRRLDEDRHPEVLGERHDVGALLEQLGRAQDRQARLDRGRAGADLVTDPLEDLGGRPDERQVARDAGAGEVGVLRQEAVAGVHRVGADGLRGVGDQLRIEVAPDGMSGLPDLVGLVGLDAVDGLAILRRVDRDAAQPELVGGAKCPRGDLPAVGDQDLAHEPGTLPGTTAPRPGPVVRGSLPVWPGRTPPPGCATDPPTG